VLRLIVYGPSPTVTKKVVGVFVRFRAPASWLYETYVQFGKINKIAGYLFIPYLLWVVCNGFEC
jgi:tryptophan-rich sensory protein